MPHEATRATDGKRNGQPLKILPHPGRSPSSSIFHTSILPSFHPSIPPKLDHSTIHSTMEDATIAALEKGRIYFATTNVICAAQLASLEKIVSLFNEEETVTGLSPATISRHRAARTRLRDILQRVCVEVFFLCAFAIPVTRLATVNAPNDFIEKLQRWWWSHGSQSGHLSEIIPELTGKFPPTGMQ